MSKLSESVLLKTQPKVAVSHTYLKANSWTKFSSYTLVNQHSNVKMDPFEDEFLIENGFFVSFGPERSPPNGSPEFPKKTKSFCGRTGPDSFCVNHPKRFQSASMVFASGKSFKFTMHLHCLLPP